MTIQKQFRGGYQLSCVDFDFFELNFGAVEEGAPPALWLTKFITECRVSGVVRLYLYT